jgi:hypothetical protein
VLGAQSEAANELTNSPRLSMEKWPRQTDRPTDRPSDSSSHVKIFHACMLAHTHSQVMAAVTSHIWSTYEGVGIEPGQVRETNQIHIVPQRERGKQAKASKPTHSLLSILLTTHSPSRPSSSSWRARASWRSQRGRTTSCAWWGRGRRWWGCC